jgi:FtsZ-binding cell division protein ZapB
MEHLIKNVEQYLDNNPILKKEGLYPELLLNNIQKIKNNYIEFNEVIPDEIESTIDKIIQIIKAYLNAGFNSDRYSTYMYDIDKILFDLTNDKMLTPNFEFIILRYLNSEIKEYLVSKQDQSQNFEDFSYLKNLVSEFYIFEKSSIDLTENLAYKSPIDFKINEVNIFLNETSTPYRNKFVYSVLTSLKKIQKIFNEKKNELTTEVDSKTYTFRDMNIEVAQLKQNLNNLNNQICSLLLKFEISPHRSRRYPTINLVFEKCKNSISIINTNVTEENICFINHKLENIVTELKSYD